MCVFVYAGDQARVSTVQGEGSLKALKSRVKKMAVLAKVLKEKISWEDRNVGGGT